jgi:integrase
MGSVYRQQGRPKWIIKYRRTGERDWTIEHTGVTDRKQAQALLRRRESDIDRGVPVGPTVDRLRWEDAVTDLETDYSNHDQSSLDDVQRRLRLHLTPVFTGRRLTTIGPDEIKAYIKRRREQTYCRRKAVTALSDDGTPYEVEPEQRTTYSNGQINRELTTLKRLFNLAKENGKLNYVPHIPLLKEQNVRKGFFDRAGLDAVCAHLPAPLDAIVTFAYLTGWRIDSEVLPLEWRHVDFASGEVRLDPEMVKNDEGRVFLMTDDLRALLRACHADHEARKKRGQIVPWVFVRMVATTRGGPKEPRQVKRFNKAWKAACAAAGLPGRIPHDLRRSAVRNMVRRGVPERVAMKLTGHKTRSIFDRYNIVSDSDLASAAVKLSGQLAARPHTDREETK